LPIAQSRVWRVLPFAMAILAATLILANLLNKADNSPPEALTGVLHKGDPDWAWYGRYVELSEPRIQMSLNMAGGRAVTFAGVIDNVGEKRLDVIELRIVFFNYEETVWETVRTPIRPGQRTGDPIDPMSTRHFSFLVHEIPDDWLASHAEMEIYGFRFER